MITLDRALTRLQTAAGRVREARHVEAVLTAGGFPCRGREAPQALLIAIDSVIASHGRRSARTIILQAARVLR